MAGGNEPKKRPGEPLRIQSETWNALVDMLAQYKRNKGFSGTGELTSLIQSKLDVFVRNETAEALPVFSVLRIAGTGFAIDFNNQFPFNRRPVIDGDIVIDNTDPIVIIQTPATDDPDQLVRGILSGLTLCKVIVNDPTHGFCEPVSGVSEYLTSVACGPIRLLGYGPIPGEGSDGSDYLQSVGSNNLYLGFVQIINNCSGDGTGSTSDGSDRTINVVTNVCPITEQAGSLESGASGDVVIGLTVEYTPITLPPGTVIGTPFCVENPSTCCPEPTPPGIATPCCVEDIPQDMEMEFYGCDGDFAPLDGTIVPMTYRGTEVVGLNTREVWESGCTLLPTASQQINYIIYCSSGELDGFSFDTENPGPGGCTYGSPFNFWTLGGFGAETADCEESTPYVADWDISGSAFKPGGSSASGNARMRFKRP